MTFRSAILAGAALLLAGTATVPNAAAQSLSEIMKRKQQEQQAKQQEAAQPAPATQPTAPSSATSPTPTTPSTTGTSPAGTPQAAPAQTPATPTAPAASQAVKPDMFADKDVPVPEYASTASADANVSSSPGGSDLVDAALKGDPLRVIAVNGTAVKVITKRGNVGYIPVGTVKDTTPLRDAEAAAKTARTVKTPAPPLSSTPQPPRIKPYGDLSDVFVEARRPAGPVAPLAVPVATVPPPPQADVGGQAQAAPPSSVAAAQPTDASPSPASKESSPAQGGTSASSTAAPSTQPTATPASNALATGGAPQASAAPAAPDGGSTASQTGRADTAPAAATAAALQPSVQGGAQAPAQAAASSAENSMFDAPAAKPALPAAGGAVDSAAPPPARLGGAAPEPARLPSAAGVGTVIARETVGLLSAANAKAGKSGAQALAGQEIDVLEKSSDGKWLHVSVGDGEGWIRKSSTADEAGWQAAMKDAANKFQDKCFEKHSDWFSGCFGIYRYMDGSDLPQRFQPGTPQSGDLVVRGPWSEAVIIRAPASGHSQNAEHYTYLRTPGAHAFPIVLEKR